MAPTPSKFPGTVPFRSPTSPQLTPNHKPQSRQASIVELLSTPPPLENTIIDPLEISGGQDNQHSHNHIHHHHHNNHQHTHTETLQRNASQSSGSSIATNLSTIRDWQDVKLSELTESAKLVFIRSDISVEDAFNVLTTHNLTSLPVEEYDDDVNCLTFDYTDLNNYLLLVLGKLQVSEQSLLANNSSLKQEEIEDYIQKAKRGEQVPVKFVIHLSIKNPFYKLPEYESLSTVLEILGTGVHRIAIVDESSTKITGILSQRRLIKYFWDNARRFPSLEPLFQGSLSDLGIGNSNVISIFGDEPLLNALIKMNTDKISSIAVVDHHFNLLGNISVTDVKFVTKSSQSALLTKSCLHFISIILNHRGIEDGKDSFPIFHVYPNSSLARTVAKLVATKSHRLWVVQPYSSQTSVNVELPAQPLISESEGRAGKLIGVVSLTDILGLIARKHGKLYVDPNQARKQRRRSSSSSSRSSASLDQFRRSISGASDLR